MSAPYCLYCKAEDADPVCGLCPSCIARFSEPENNPEVEDITVTSERISD